MLLARFGNAGRNRKGAAGAADTVATLDAFRTKFNPIHPNVLAGLQPTLESEPVFIAGGSVLNALTAGETQVGRL